MIEIRINSCDDETENSLAIIMQNVLAEAGYDVRFGDRYVGNPMRTRLGNISISVIAE